MVKAVGIGTLALTENTQLIEKTKRSKRSRIRIPAKLEHNWNTEMSSSHPNPTSHLVNLQNACQNQPNKQISFTEVHGGYTAPRQISSRELNSSGFSDPVVLKSDVQFRLAAQIPEADSELL